MRTLLSLKLAYRHVRAGIGRMALSVLAVALGVALVVAIRLMNAAVLASFVDAMDALSGRAALSVTAGEGFSFAEDIVETVAAVPGVKLAVPLVRSVAFPDDESGELLTVQGVDLTHDASVRLYHESDTPEDVVDDLLVFLSQPDSIILGREFAERRGLAVGSRLDLVTPSGVRSFTVRGLLEPQGLAKTLGGRLVVMDLYAAERMFTADKQINQVDVVLEQSRDLATVGAAISARLPAGLNVEVPSVRKEMIRRAVGGFQAVLTAFALLAVVAGFVICYGRLGAIFEARTWEVGLLRAVGLRRSVVFGELLKESVVMAAAGTAVGLPLGALIGRYGLPVLATATALNFRLPPTAAAPVFDGWALGLGAFVGLGAGIAAAAIPALRLARKQPVAALTMRGRETDPLMASNQWSVVGMLVVLVAVLLAWQRTTRTPVVGNATTAVMVVAACALAGPLVRRGGLTLVSLWRRMFGPTGGFAAGHVVQRGRRAALTVATLGVGVGAVLMFGILGWSFERSLVSQVTARLHGDLVVTSTFNSAGWVSSPLSETVLDEIRDVSGVTRAVGVRVADVPYRGAALTLYAYDPSCFQDPRVCDWRLATGALSEALTDVAGGGGAIVSPSFAERFSASPGDILQFDSPRGPQTFRVVGVTTTQPDVAVIINRDEYRKAWNDARVTWALVSLREGRDRTVVEVALARRLGERYRVQVRPVAGFIAHLASQAHDAFRALYLMQVVTLLLVSIGLGDTLAAGVLERTRTFGMMRAIGLRQSRLFGMVLLEGAAIGVLGLLLAVAVGAALGAFWVNVQFPAMLGWTLTLHCPVEFVIFAGLSSLLLCLAGSLLPSLRAARLSVPAALRDE